MSILDKYNKKKKKELLKLIKDKRKAEKRIEKEMNKRAETKYTTKYLKENKKLLTENAITIDKLEYEKMVMDLKERLMKKE